MINRRRGEFSISSRTGSICLQIHPQRPAGAPAPYSFADARFTEVGPKSQGNLKLGPAGQEGAGGKVAIVGIPRRDPGVGERRCKELRGGSWAGGGGLSIGFW